MQARKAYISSLGTTGVLIASSLLLLAVVGALVAFDRWPNQAAADPLTVQVAREAPDTVRRSADRHSVSQSAALPARVREGLRSDAALRQVAARAGRVERRAGGAGAGDSRSTASHSVLSGYQAPDTVPGSAAAGSLAAGGGATGGSAPNPSTGVLPQLPGSLAPSEGGAVTGTTDAVGDTAEGLSPSLGETVRDTGTVVDGTTSAILGGS